MEEQYASVAAAVAAIESAAGGRWAVWLSDTGWWWATRTCALSADARGAGCVQHIQAHSPDELADLIRQQDSLMPESAPVNQNTRKQRH